MTNAGPKYQAGALDLGALKARAEAAADGGGKGFEPIITASETNLEEEVLRTSTKIPVVVHVGTQRSPDSQELKSALENLAKGQRRFRLACVDADASPAVAQVFGVRVLPTVIAIAAGRPVTSFEGNQPADQLSDWVDALVANVGSKLPGLGPDDGATEGEGAQQSEDPRMAQARDAANRGEYDAAAAAYDAILAEDPAHGDAKRARAAVDVARRLDSARRSGDPVEPAEAEPGDVDEQLAAADAEVLGGEAEKAFARLIGLVKTEPRAKERLLELFTLFEPGDPRVAAARTQLASALF